MATYKTSELNEKQLNRVVADIEDFDNGDWFPDYSIDWAHGGPIIEREQIMFQSAGANGITAYLKSRGTSGVTAYGETHLIAAMRCFVAANLGDEIEISDLLK